MCIMVVVSYILKILLLCYANANWEITTLKPTPIYALAPCTLILHSGRYTRAILEVVVGY